MKETPAFDIKMIAPLYQEEEVLLGDVDGTLYLRKGTEDLRVSDHLYEPYICLSRKDGSSVTIHNAFTVEELRGLAENGGTIQMITGDEYDLKGVCELLLLSEELSQTDMDISYLEGRKILRRLEEAGAISSSSALDPDVFGKFNHHILDPFLHAKRIGKTEDGRYYIRKRYEQKGSAVMDVKWVDGSTISVRIDGKAAVISANREGLLSLAGQLAAMAEERPGCHIHYDEYNSLEEGSAELIVELVPGETEGKQES